jgi:hypothetical protein
VIQKDEHFSCFSLLYFLSQVHYYYYFFVKIPVFFFAQ